LRQATGLWLPWANANSEAKTLLKQSLQQQSPTAIEYITSR